jgi:spore maturation protein CgeB
MPHIVNGAWTDRKRSEEILQSAWIGINLSLSDPDLDRNNTHISPRVFDILMSGRLLITEEVPLIHEVLPDCSYHCFSNEPEALNIVHAICVHPEKEHESIVKNRKAIKSGHLYANRVQRIIELTC